MPRLNDPIRKKSAVFIKSVSEGKETFRREPYNIVSLDFMDGTEVKTFVEPICGRPLSPSEKEEVYDEVRFYDSPPFPKTQIGFAR